MPISSDAIESLFGVAKRHGVGQTQDAGRIALRLPAWCGTPTREEAEQVMGLSVARQHEITGPFTSLTKQRRKVLGHRRELESRGQSPGAPYGELLPSSKNRSTTEGRYTQLRPKLGIFRQLRPKLGIMISGFAWIPTYDFKSCFYSWQPFGLQDD